MGMKASMLQDKGKHVLVKKYASLWARRQVYIFESTQRMPVHTISKQIRFVKIAILNVKTQH